VLGVLPGIIGTIQATEAVKLVLGIGEPLVGRFLIYDALKMRFRELRLPRDRDCPVCGDAPTIIELREYEEYCSPAGAARDAGGSNVRQHDGVPGPEDAMRPITVVELKARMDAGTAPLVVDVREPREFEICRIPGAILIPLCQLPSRAHELDPRREVVLQCRSGVRSARAAALLRDLGFTSARNLTGGILAWIDQVDPSLPKY
jgi:adenylyltransferase/sulfurtransferase